ncbi:hypothetical protein ACIBCH_09675 [Amycolatopsis thailandensis]|uniref:hypothetical protein n=1 Tax=Amycolatopsis thailandensis TaxID=589330 RepID=UPI0037B7A04C
MSHLPPFIPGFAPPTDHEVIVGYWKEQAVAGWTAHHERLAEYDLLTGFLEQAFGPNWRRKLAKAVDRRGPKGGKR